MSELKPFNVIWLNCFANLELSLLNNLKEKCEIFAYENKYSYLVKKSVSGGGNEFQYISLTQKNFLLNNFVKLEQWNIEDENIFFERVIQHMKKPNCYLMINVDLFNWLEGSLCWQKYHWNHYSLVTNFKKNTEEFTVFDEKYGNYISFNVKKEKMFSSLFQSDDKYGVVFLELNMDYHFPKITVKKLMRNAGFIIESINQLSDIFLWKMGESDYNAKSHLDLMGVYLQRVEGQQDANVHLFMQMNKREQILEGEVQEYFVCEFNKLRISWRLIRMQLYKLYLTPVSRKEKLECLNNEVKNTLIQEQNLWMKFIDIFNEKEEMLTVDLY